jgi:hypothetical protein
MSCRGLLALIFVLATVACTKPDPPAVPTFSIVGNCAAAPELDACGWRANSDAIILGELAEISFAEGPLLDTDQEGLLVSDSASCSPAQRPLVLTMLNVTTLAGPVVVDTVRVRVGSDWVSRMRPRPVQSGRAVEWTGEGDPLRVGQRLGMSILRDERFADGNVFYGVFFSEFDGNLLFSHSRNLGDCNPVPEPALDNIPVQEVRPLFDGCADAAGSNTSFIKDNMDEPGMRTQLDSGICFHPPALDTCDADADCGPAATCVSGRCSFEEPSP